MAALPSLGTSHHARNEFSARDRTVLAGIDQLATAKTPDQFLIILGQGSRMT